jgi:hypothetical protein
VCVSKEKDRGMRGGEVSKYVMKCRFDRLEGKGDGFCVWGVV